jgi:hypothetical protein
MQEKKTMTFRFDEKECTSGDCYLTPLYFNKQVLIRYLYDSRYQCDFASETYGSIHGGDFDISFGINSDGNVLMWLGDVHKLPLREQFYVLTENIDPQNNYASEFFDAQIGAEFTEPPLVIQMLNNLRKLNSSFNEKFNFHLYKDASIEDRIEETRRYKRIHMGSDDDFKRFISEINEIINENTNNSDIKKFIKANESIFGMLDSSSNKVEILFGNYIELKESIDAISAHITEKTVENIGFWKSIGDNKIRFKDKASEGLKGNKLLEIVYRKLLNDTGNLIAPFFVLYDIRLWSDHSINLDLYEQSIKKLGLTLDATKQEVFDKLIESINQSILKLIEIAEFDVIS